MRILAAVDDSGGMAFHNRRQSQDRVLRQKILELTAGKILRMSPYSAKQFQGVPNAPQLMVSCDFLRDAGADDYCFVESGSLLPWADRIQEVILFRWNRRYPGDAFFDLPLESGWKQTETEDFPGFSHEKITKEVYRRG